MIAVKRQQAEQLEKQRDFLNIEWDANDKLESLLDRLEPLI